ncbi:PRTRC genetic system protein F [Robbsia andropogonis]|uniref:PRTRC system protein F n=1 Tax=Robbsia andropogonis TaxID=28092 RepID=UPI003D1AE664
MLFDPEHLASDISVESGGAPFCAAPPYPRCGLANDFLTLPEISGDVPTIVVKRDSAQIGISAFALMHFQYGAIRAADVESVTAPLEAFAQGFFAWMRRLANKWTRLCLAPVLLDAAAVAENLAYSQMDVDIPGEAVLYMGLKTDLDYIRAFRPSVVELAKSQPLLMHSCLQTIAVAAASLGIHLRTADDLLEMFSYHYWEGDPEISDEDAAEFMAERFGESDEERSPFLPSTIRADLLGNGLSCVRVCSETGRLVRDKRLRPAQLVALAQMLTGHDRAVCDATRELELLIRRTRGDCFPWDVQCEQVYSAATIVTGDDALVGQILDDHYQYFNQGGDGSLFHGFMQLANEPKAIGRQYRRIARGIEILNSLDRLIGLLTEEQK